MGRKPRRSKPPSKKRPAVPTGGDRRKSTEESEWGQLRRNRPVSVQYALVVLALLALLAGGSDLALYEFIADHYRRHGHLGVRLDFVLMALGFTAVAVYMGVAIIKDFRRRVREKRAKKRDSTASRQHSRKSPS